MLPASSRNRGILILAFALLVAGAIWLWPTGEEPAAQSAAGAGPAGVPVAVARVEQRDVVHRVSSIGAVQSLHTVVIRPQVTGILTQLLFKEGDIVQRGAQLARIDDRSIAAALAQAEAEKSSREAQLRIAELDLTRYGNLGDQRVISRQQMEQQAALVERLKADVRASEASIAAQQVQLSHTRIVSPVTGRVGMRRVDPGNLVQASNEEGLVTVTQIDPISIVFTLPQEAIARLDMQSGSGSGLRVTAFERDAGIALASGTVSTFDNQIDASTGTLRLRAEFANPDGKLWPGQFVALQLETGISAGLLVFPARALQQGLNGPFVFRIRDSKAEVVPLTTTYQDDEIAAVREGLAAGDVVVMDGQSRLKAGTAVKIPGAAGDSSVAGT